MATAETRTLVLGRNDVARLLPLRELAGALGDGFIRHSTEPQAEAARAEAAVDGAPMRAVLPGLLAGYDGCSARVDLHRPAGDGASGRPLPSGALLLVDRASGRPRAIVEATLIGAMSAAAAGALAVTALARAGAGRVALFGAGMQGAWQLGALHAVGRLEAASIFDVEGSRARQLADELARHFKAATRAVDSPEAALDGADVIVTVTPTRAAWLRREQVRPGVHVNALGADEPGKVELEAALLKGSKLVVDDRAEALRRGALNVAVTGGQLDGGAIHAELGEVLAGRRPGREGDDERTVFAGAGLAFQDLVAAELVYRRAVERGVGTFVDFA